MSCMKNLDRRFLNSAIKYMINSRMLTIKWPTWLEDHWAAAMAVLATEKALTRFPSGSNKSLTKAKGRVSKQTVIPISDECGRFCYLKSRILKSKEHRIDVGKSLDNSHYYTHFLALLAKSTPMVFPSNFKGGCSPCKMVSSWEASCEREGYSDISEASSSTRKTIRKSQD